MAENFEQKDCLTSQIGMEKTCIYISYGIGLKLYWFECTKIQYSHLFPEEYFWYINIFVVCFQIASESWVTTTATDATSVANQVTSLVNVVQDLGRFLEAEAAAVVAAEAAAVVVVVKEVIGDVLEVVVLLNVVTTLNTIPNFSFS